MLIPSPGAPAPDERPPIRFRGDGVISLTGREPSGGHRVTVRVPALLIGFAGGARDLDAAGATLGDAIEGLAVHHAELTDVLLTGEHGERELSPFVNVYLNGEDARALGGLDAPLQEDDEVVLLVALAGG